MIAYSVSLIQEYLLKSNKSIDFQAVWSNDGVDIPETIIKELLMYINELLLKNLEALKLSAAFSAALLSKVDWCKLDSMIELLPVCEVKKLKKNAGSEFNLDSKYDLIVDEINKMLYTISSWRIVQ